MPLAWETHTTSCKYLGLIFVLGMSVYWERRGFSVTPFTSQSLPHWFKMNFYFQLVVLECFSVNFWVSLVFLKIGWLHFPRFVKCEGVFFFSLKRLFQIFYVIWTINLKHLIFWFPSKQVITHELNLRGPSGLGQVKPASCVPPEPASMRFAQRNAFWGASPKSNKKPLFGNHQWRKEPTGMFVITSGTSLFKLQKPQFLFQRFKLQALACSCYGG